MTSITQPTLHDADTSQRCARTTDAQTLNRTPAAGSLTFTEILAAFGTSVVRREQELFMCYVEGV